jgi:hypothetical protein
LNKQDYEQAIAEFLANGGEIQQIPTGKSSPNAGASAWGRPQAKPKDITDINVDSLD